MAALDRPFAEHEICKASVRAGSVVFERSAAQCWLIVRPMAANRARWRDWAGNTGRGLWWFSSSNQPGLVECGRRDRSAGIDLAQDDKRKVGRIFAFEIQAAGDARGSGGGTIRAGSAAYPGGELRRRFLSVSIGPSDTASQTRPLPGDAFSVRNE